MSRVGNSQLCIIGGGNMGSALARGLLAGGLSSDQLVIVEKDKSRVVELEKQFPQIVITSELPSCESVILAVKPAEISDVCSRVAKAGAKQILSIAAGVTIAAIERAANDSVAVVRAMPNTPALIGQGASAMAVSAKCDAENIKWAREILLSVGTVVEVQENLLDAVTGLSGSGPAYIFLLAEALIDAGVKQGLSAEVSNELVRQLLVGSSMLLRQSSETPTKLRENVTSPNGTTAAGIAELMGKQFAETIDLAVSAATSRSKELGK